MLHLSADAMSLANLVISCRTLWGNPHAFPSCLSSTKPPQMSHLLTLHVEALLQSADGCSGKQAKGSSSTAECITAPTNGKCKQSCAHIRSHSTSPSLASDPQSRGFACTADKAVPHSPVASITAMGALPRQAAGTIPTPEGLWIQHKEVAAEATPSHGAVAASATHSLVQQPQEAADINSNAGHSDCFPLAEVSSTSLTLLLITSMVARMSTKFRRDHGKPLALTAM